jgi:uncharacterized protein YndB with AHSA1/START domain
MIMDEITERSQVHATFVIERDLDAPLDRVWHALSDSDARDQWFGGGPTFDIQEKSHAFYVGGRAVEDGQWHGGPRSRFESTYTDIVVQQRIVFTYDMWVDDQHLSTSLTTIAIEAEGDRTSLTYTEQGVHFDGLDSAEGREQGTRGILDQLSTYLTTER